MTRKQFTRWIKNLGDANLDTCLKWFGNGKTWDECYKYLLQSWDREEIATSFMAK